MNPAVRQLLLGASRFDYHVDSVNGSDYSDGKTPARAFRTIAKLETVLGSSYDRKRIGLARGSYWREQIGGLGDWGSNVVIKAYGSGAMPVLDGADVVPADSWAKTGALTNVYDTSWVHEASSGSVISVWEDGVRLRWVASTALCDATPGTYYVATVTTSPSAVYVHATGSGDPDTNGKTYEISSREWGLMTGEIGSNWLIEYVHTKRTTNGNGSLEAVNNCRVNWCLAEDGWKHNLFIGADSIADGCIAWKADYPNRSNATMFVGFTSDGSGKRVTFRRCVAICDPAIGEAARAASISVDGFYSHTTGAAKEWDAVIYEDCAASGVVTGFAAADCDLFTNTRNYAYDVNKGFLLGGTVHTAYDCKVMEGPTVTHIGATETTAGTSTIEGMRHYCFDGTSRGSVYAAGTATVTVTKSVLARDTTATGSSRIMVNGNAVGSQVNSSYNIITASTNTTAYRITGTGSADNNVYWPATIDFNIGASSYTSFALYKAAELSYDQASVASDPLLVDPANGDFNVTGGSPAIAMGAGLERPNVTYLPIPSDVALAAM
jgi:hypothetical protein